MASSVRCWAEFGGLVVLLVRHVLERFRQILSHLFFLRVPLTVIGLAGGLPYLLTQSDFARGFGANLLTDVPDGQAIFSILITVMCLSSAVCSASLISGYGYLRFGTKGLQVDEDELAKGEEYPARWAFRTVSVVAVLALGFAAYWIAEPAVDRVDGPGGKLSVIAWGLLSSVAVILLIILVFERLVVGQWPGFRRVVSYVDWSTWSMEDGTIGGTAEGQPTFWARVIRFLFRVFPASTPGYYAAGGVLKGHAFSFVLANAALILYLFAAWWGYLDIVEMGVAVEFQAYAFVVFGLMLICWIFSLITFIFDRHHIPLLSVVLLYSLGIGCVVDRDYYFKTTEYARGGDGLGPETRPVGPTPSAAIRSRLAMPSNQGGRKKLVLVAAKGGGIQAAAWTAQVLVGIEQDLEEHGMRAQWRERLALISGVSGGSVGAYYYLDRWPALQTSQAELGEVVDAATADKLRQVAWGLTVPDFLRVVLPVPMQLMTPFDDPRYVDRGWALQQAIQKDALAASRDATLSDWTEGARRWTLGEVPDGDWMRAPRPPVIFNATIAEQGKPLVFSTTNFRPEACTSEAAQSVDFRTVETCEDGTPVSGRNNRDIAVSNAVRLSSSFPIVSPASRAYGTDIASLTNHINDGGYYDNYGIRSLARWLADGLTELYQEPELLSSGLDVLILQILPEEAKHEDKLKDAAVPAEQLIFIPGTLYHVAMGSQPARNDEFVKTFRQAWEADPADVCVQKSNIEFGCGGEDWCDGSAPMNWRLTGRQKRAIEETWHSNHDERWTRRIREFLNSTDPPAGCPVLAGEASARED